MEKKDKNIVLFFKLLKDKNYDELFNTFGQSAYVFFADLKYKKQDISSLIDKKDYSTLIKKYGYLEPFIGKEHKKIFKELISNGDYMDIINIFGYDFYEKNKYKIIKSGIAKETGNKVTANGAVFKEGFKNILENILKTAYIYVFAFNIFAAQLRVSFYNESINNNKEILEEYNERTKEYVDNFKELGLDNDLDIVMKVLSDMWDEIDGYGTPNCESIGLYRIAFSKDNQPGVCRNLADDFSNRLNEINPLYDASTLVVNVDFDYYTKNSMANIERKTASNYVESDYEDEEDNMFGNHMVSIFKPIGKDYTLVVDPTNPSIGIIANGKIYLFSTIDGKGLEFKPVGQIFLSLEAGYGKTRNIFYKSLVLQKSKKELEELNKEWGNEAQNRSLERIKELKITN